MAAFGFLGAAARQYGINQLQQLSYDDQKATVDYKQAMAQQMQASAAQTRAHVQASQQVSAFLQSESAKDNASMQTPLDAAKRYDQASSMYLQAGDMEGAKEMMALAKGKRSEAMDQATAVQQQKAQAHEDAATAALDYKANPSKENAQKLADASLKAGFNPAQIPKDDAGFDAWLNNMQTAGMTSKQRLEFTEKQNEFKQKQMETEQHHRETEQAHRDSMAQTAAFREQTFELRREAMAARKAEADARAPTQKDMTDPETGQPMKYEWDPSGKLDGKRDQTNKGWVQVGDKALGERAQFAVNRTFTSAGEIVRGLTQMSKLPPGTSTSPFKGGQSGDVKQAFLNVGANSLTPTQTQFANANAQGLGNEFANLMAAFGGRMGGEHMQQELQNMATVAPGDTGYTALYKRANAASIVRTYLENLPPQVQKDPRAKALHAALDNFGTPEQALELARKGGFNGNVSEAKARKDYDKLLADSKKAAKNVDITAVDMGLPGAGSGGASAGEAAGLPAGWSVKEH